MAKTLLQQLREMTVVVADMGDIQAIELFKPQDATTNPSLITAAAQMPQYQDIVDDTLKGARNTLRQDAELAFDRLAVSFGLKSLKYVQGIISGEIVVRSPLKNKVVVNWYLSCLNTRSFFRYNHNSLQLSLLFIRYFLYSEYPTIKLSNRCRSPPYDNLSKPSLFILTKVVYE